MHRVLGRDAGALEGFAEGARIGLADAQFFGAEREIEVIGQPQAAHVGVAVGQHAEAVVVGEQLQGRVHFGKQLHRMPRFEKHLEGLLGQLARFVPRIAGFLQRMAENAPPQLADAMTQFRLRVQQGAADGAQRLDGEIIQIGCVPGQPLAQGKLGAVQDGADVPERVVEVEGDQSDAHDSLSCLRLARGCAWS